ncbi:hypothetical protein HYC85_029989 [Camellia sinensis]|uniref:RNase H type-1 domain-containing protein n=1 Tax=Camellia sinensis TaxID=4442 RepID=A0A7J7G254_CAMSI|nr:hypothetical protein HYC85_029989 [Camellia sinensis]
MGVISVKLPREAWDLVLKIQLPRFITYPDMPHWKGSRCGEFSTVASYELVTDSGVDSGNWLCWSLPPPSKLKMNTDGSSKGDPGDGGFGGLIRDERGMWLCGYFGKLTNCTCIEAEILALYRGLTIAFEKGYKDLSIETDSQYAIDMLKGNVEVFSPLRSLVEDSKFLIRRCGFLIQHVKREGNMSANGLAKMGANQNEVLVVMDDPPEEIRGQLVADMVGQSYLRHRSGDS